MISSEPIACTLAKYDFNFKQCLPCIFMYQGQIWNIFVPRLSSLQPGQIQHQICPVFVLKQNMIKSTISPSVTQASGRGKSVLDGSQCQALLTESAKPWDDNCNTKAEQYHRWQLLVHKGDKIMLCRPIKLQSFDNETSKFTGSL